MLATHKRLGVLTSFRRPGVRDDSSFSDALFHAAKCRPDYPHEPFTDLAHASAWVAVFGQLYNHEYRHSAIRFVTPAQRHDRHNVAFSRSPPASTLRPTRCSLDGRAAPPATGHPSRASP